MTDYRKHKFISLKVPHNPIIILVLGIDMEHFIIYLLTLGEMGRKWTFLTRQNMSVFCYNNIFVTNKLLESSYCYFSLLIFL